MRYYFRIVLRAISLHLQRWNRFRADVLTWVIAIWCGLGIQAVFVYVTFSASGGNFFGYSGNEVFGFFGVSLIASGIAESVVVGVIINLSKAVWQGRFDHWLLEPPPLLLRIITEDLGLVWYWPHICAGTLIVLSSLPDSLWPLAFACAGIAATIEMAIVLLLCIPGIRWGRWDPYEGLWEYLESAKSIPIGRSKSFMLWIASFGVLQYSLALEVVTGRFPFWGLLLIALGLWMLVLLALKFFVRSYASASS